MVLSSGTRLGPYEIAAPLGAGGMGEVYRARDTRLGREVAIKVLPADVARDADRRARFEREARAVAALSHPNILAIHDIGVDGDQLYVVTELLEGESLADRLRAGALPVRKSVEIAIAIARGLAAAHGKGIAHRDLKPANVFLLGDGQVKILDFGLAREMGQGQSGATETQAALTDPGTILGTAGYMAPEQIRGQQIDGRADLFALGVVLYEMLTGQRAFARETTAETLTAILKEDPPDLTTARADLPPALGRIVGHALEKNPAERFQSARDVVFALEALSGTAQIAATSPATTPTGLWRYRGVVAALIAGLAIGTAIAIAVWGQSEGAIESTPVRFEMGLRARDIPFFPAPAVSPNSRMIAYVAARGDSDSELVVHALADGTVRPLPGTRRAMRPTWSPDSTSIAFFMDARLYRVSLNGQPPVAICDVPGFSAEGASVAWGADDVLIYSPNFTSALHTVSADGGTPRALTVLDTARKETAHSWPAFLPDGRRFVFSASRAAAAGRTLMVASLAPESEPRAVTEVETNAVVVGAHLLHIRQRSLLAQPIDPQTLAIAGDPVTIASQVLVWDTGRSFHAAPDLVVAVRSNRTAALRWFDRQGRADAPLELPGSPYWTDLSPDGRRIAVDVENQDGIREVWMIEADRKTRLTFGTTSDSDVVWSPDGERLVYSHDTGRALHEIMPGQSKSHPIHTFDGPDSAYPTDWSLDGRFVAYASWASGGNPGQWLLPLAPGAQPMPIAATAFHEHQGRFSPDSRFLAFSENSSGRPEVVIEALPPLKGRWPVSTGGGADPKWRRDGKELFYLSSDGTMMAVPIALGASPEVGTPKPLFKTEIGDSLFYAVRNHYVVTPDGQRFLVNQVSGSPYFEATLNWTPRQAAAAAPR